MLLDLKPQGSFSPIWVIRAIEIGAVRLEKGEVVERFSGL